MNANHRTDELTEEQRSMLERCKTPEEIVACCKENGIALPEELVEGVAGGSIMGSYGAKHPCPKCGSANVGLTPVLDGCLAHCWDCSHTWKA
jgi:hypothetical protein